MTAPLPPKPPARADRVSLWRYGKLFRQDILSAQPARLYRAWMAEFKTPFFRSYLMNQPDLLDTAVEAGAFKTLVTAVKAAELVETLKGKGPFTVFAPTDDAFGKLPEGTVAELVKPENKAKLQAILTYHVVSGAVLSKQIAEGATEVATVQGGKLKITRDSMGVRVNGAKVVKADIITGNGVIHVIDAVVLPE